MYHEHQRQSRSKTTSDGHGLGPSEFSATVLSKVWLFVVFFFLVNLCGTTYLGSLVAGWEMGNLLLPGISIWDVQCVWWSCVVLERQGLPDRRDVHPKPPVISCSCAHWLTPSGSVSLHEDTVFQVQSEGTCPCLDPVTFPFFSLWVLPNSLPSPGSKRIMALCSL